MKRFTALLALIVWTLGFAASASASMIVLCVEQNGQRTVEYSADSHCYDSSISAETDQSIVKSAAHCADCVDIPLSAPASAGSPKVAKDIISSQIGAFVTAYLSTAWYPNQASLGLVTDAPEEFALRSAYIGQRPNIVIQQ